MPGKGGHRGMLQYLSGVQATRAFVKISRALAADAGRIAGLLELMAAERIHSALDQPWTAEEERRYVESLSPREAAAWVSGLRTIITPGHHRRH
jgi:hypothetical protein